MAGWLTNFEKNENMSSLDLYINLKLVNKITTDIPFMYHDSKDLSSDDVVEAVSNLCSNMKISQEECDCIEVNTRGQAGNSI